MKDLAEGAERQATGQAKGFTNSTANTSLISRTHRELLQLDRKKTTQLENGRDRHVPKEGTGTANKHTERRVLLRRISKPRT